MKDNTSTHSLLLNYEHQVSMKHLDVELARRTAALNHLRKYQ